MNETIPPAVRHLKSSKDYSPSGIALCETRSMERTGTHKFRGGEVSHRSSTKAKVPSVTRTLQVPHTARPNHRHISLVSILCSRHPRLLAS